MSDPAMDRLDTYLNDQEQTMEPTQVALLDEKLDRTAISSRKQGNMELHYIEGWYAIQQANRIFGYDGWTTEIKNLTSNDPEEYEKNGKVMYRVYATCIMRLTALGTVHEDVGYGSGFGQAPGDCIEGAVKEAATDAQKRCLRHWGNQFGLALYDKEKKGVKSREEQAAQ